MDRATHVLVLNPKVDHEPLTTRILCKQCNLSLAVEEILIGSLSDPTH